MTGHGAGFGIYVHWPYCSRICPYCDFNVYRARDRDPAPLLAAILADASGHAKRIGRRTVDSVFLGGGTPSLLSGPQIGALLEGLNAAFPFAADVEITLEANPEDANRFGEHVHAGVNRFSVGVQALDDASLKALGRWHDAAAARAAVVAASKTGARVSMDLIYARPGQTVSAWDGELRAALALPVEHLSLYQLTIEQGTAFDRAVRRGRITPPPIPLAADLYEVTQALCEATDAPAYEVSNHARGAAAQSRHNLIYWQGGEWIGLGPGAHGRVALDGARIATLAQRAPDAYAATVRETGLGWAESTRLTGAEAAEEALMMGLRLTQGISIALIEQTIGPLDTAVFESDGLLRRSGDVLTVTPAGRLLTDRVAMELLARV